MEDIANHINYRQNFHEIPNHGNFTDIKINDLVKISREDLENLAKSHKKKEIKIDLKNTDFSFVDLRGIDLGIFVLDGSLFANAIFDQLSLKSVLLLAKNGKILLKKINCQGINLEARWLDRSDLGMSSYVRFDLAGIDLEEANFSHANLEFVDFDGANLKAANFEYSILNGALMRSCNLVNANFRNCELKNSNFKGSNLMNADLAFSDLTGVKL